MNDLTKDFKRTWCSIEDLEEYEEGNVSHLEIDFQKKEFKFVEDYKGYEKMEGFVGAIKKEGKGTIFFSPSEKLKGVVIQLNSTPLKVTLLNENGEKKIVTERIMPSISFVYDEGTGNLKAPNPEFPTERYFAVEKE